MSKGRLARRTPPALTHTLAHVTLMTGVMMVALHQLLEPPG